LVSGAAAEKNKENRHACRHLCRLSSDQLRDASIEDQIRICRSLIKQDVYRLVDTHADHAISGASSQRPGYQAMLVASRCSDAFLI
jgi:DNA invertase Pin-like site-specific DNA recombinase